MIKRLIPLFALLLALCIPAAAGAYEDTLEVYDVKSGEDVGDYIDCAGTYAATGSVNGDGIKVAAEGTTYLYLDGVYIGTYNSPALDCSEADGLVLILGDGTENILLGGMGCAGIFNADVPLSIYCERAFDGEAGHVCDDDCGFLAAIGSADGYYSSAGIGGGTPFIPQVSWSQQDIERFVSGSNITIYGGNIVAEGGEYAAGIGGGNYGDWVRSQGESKWVFRTGDGSNIKILGGRVQAHGGDGAAGIGGAMDARLFEGDYDFDDIAEFGGGDGKNITIAGGEVEALGGMMAPGIGGGYLGQGKNITISGGMLYAEGCSSPAYESDTDDEDTVIFAPVGSGVTFPEDDVTPAASGIVIAPKAGKRIVAKVDELESGEPIDLEGSPFTSRKDVTKTLQGHFILATMEEDAPVTALPSTGDRSSVILWAALLSLSAAAAFGLRRRTA